MADPTDDLAVVAPGRRSWVDVPERSDFPLQNLPFGVGRRVGEPLRLLVAIGDHALDLAAVGDAGLLDRIDGIHDLVHADSLHPLLQRDRATWRILRAAIADLLDADDTRLQGTPLAERALLRRDELELHVPVRPRDYVDFYSSEPHARNVGAMFRPDDDPLLPNWKHLPVGYHGRSGTVVVSGTPIVRPAGQRAPAGTGGPSFGPSQRLDIELEVGWIAGGASNPMGSPVSIDDAGEHIFGFVLLNDWSARDIQAWEYRPLGPFLGKSFATSISPWVVTTDALAPYRTPGPPQDPEPLPYLRTDEPWGLDVDLEVALTPAGGHDEHVISRTSFAGMYWTAAQQLAHLTANGATVHPGDLHGSGTVSGTEPGTYGSLLELSWNGERPLELDGATRAFLEDGDTVTLRGAGTAPGRPRIGFGEVRGTILPAH